MDISSGDNNLNVIDALGPLSSQLMAGNKLSHKTWRNVLKKLKRKLKRRKDAQHKELEKGSCNGDASEDDAVAEHIRQKEMQLQSVEHARWLQREKKAEEEWLKKKWLEEQEKKRQEEQDRLIREEWEEQQRKEREEEEEEKKKKEKQDALLSEATANEKLKNGLQPWHNPLAPAGYGKEVEVCTFFMKTGACRFGERCSRSHPEPETCNTLMFPGMYSHMTLDKGQDDYDADLTLEFEEGEIYDDFKQFYEDVLPEFKNVGQVVQFKVSCNFEPHLRGNVYIQYKTEEEALKAYIQFNGRWYGGKQLSCQVVEIKRWVSAICGLYNENRCHKGKSCNFLHVFRNPTREFNQADRDFDSQNYRHPQSYRRREHSVRSHHSSSRYKRSYRSDYSRRSCSPSTSRSVSRQSSSYKRRRIDSSPRHSSQIRSSKRSRHRSRSRSRSQSRPRSYSRSRSRSRPRSHSRSRSRSRPRSHSRSRSRSRPRSHSRSRSRSRPRSHSRSRSRSRPRIRSRSRSKSRSSSPQSSKLSSSKSEKYSYSYQNSKRQKRSHHKYKSHSKKSKSHSKSRSKSKSSNKLSSKSHERYSSSSSTSSSPST